LNVPKTACVTALVVIVVATAYARATEPDDVSLDYHLTSGHDDTRVNVSLVHKSLVFDITSPRGIDHLHVQRKGADWPDKLVVRLRLKGLEHFAIDTDKCSLAWSVPSHGEPNSRMMRFVAKQELPVAIEDPCFAAIRIIAKNHAIPLNDGYFELTLPTTCLDGNPEEIKFRWIDFYRN
jgi:hypothetical protein